MKRWLPSQPCLQGVLLTHQAVASEVQSLGSWMASLGFGADTEKDRHDDVYLSFLPLAHIYGRWAGVGHTLPADCHAPASLNSAGCNERPPPDLPPTTHRSLARADQLSLFPLKVCRGGLSHGWQGHRLLVSCRGL